MLNEWIMMTFGWRCESETRVPSSGGLVKQYNQELCISLIMMFNVVVNYYIAV